MGKAQKAALLYILILAAFFYGYAVARFGIPPSAFLESIVQEIKTFRAGGVMDEHKPYIGLSGHGRLGRQLCAPRVPRADQEIRSDRDCGKFLCFLLRAPRQQCDGTEHEGLAPSQRFLFDAHTQSVGPKRTDRSPRSLVRGAT